MSSFGKNINISIFGESHFCGVGVLISGLPAGLDVDLDYIKSQLNRRRPGTSKLSSARKEDDAFNIMSGVYNGKTTSDPMLVFFENKDVKSKDYNPDILRPSHVDYPALIKTQGYVDLRGSGRYSGRLTAGLVFTGALLEASKQLGDILICSHISKVKNLTDAKIQVSDYTLLKNQTMPFKNLKCKATVEQLILDTKKTGDSLGAVVEVCAYNVPVGLSGGFFDSLESKISQLLFSVPSVKGVSFGLGFEYSNYLGSEVSDEYQYIDGKLTITSNNNGGIIGGMSTGNPLVCTVSIKPTASILKPQKTVNIKTKENIDYQITGRHDPAIFSRIAVILESCVTIVLYDMLRDFTQK